MKKYLLTLSLLPLAVFNSQAHAAKIYTCEINGSIVYTSRPSGNCQTVNDLPIVGKYSSSRYDAPVSDAPTLDAPTSQTAPAKSKNTAAKSNHKATPKPAPVRTASETAPPPVPMEERAKIIGAAIQILSEPGKGTKVHLRVENRLAEDR